MNLNTYKTYWEQNNEILQVVDLRHVEKIDIDQYTLTFLTSWGLPSSTAPFLSFRELTKGEILSVNIFFNLDWPELDSFLVIGTNGSGDPICIDKSVSEEIVYLNHDNDFERFYINKDIYKFANSLIRYHQFISLLIDNSNPTYERKKFTDESFEEFKSDFLTIDDTSLDVNSFWSSELDALLWERDQE